VTLPDEITVVPMRELAWRMAVLVSEEVGISTLGLEVVAAGEALSARLLVFVSSRDDSPGIRRACLRRNIGYATRPMTCETNLKMGALVKSKEANQLRQKLRIR
jgi:hypothetical protein